MAGFKLDAKARLSIELALTTGRDDPIFARQQEEDAKERRTRHQRDPCSPTARGTSNGKVGSLSKANP
ncbi:MAG: hypothetical protein E5Y10_33550 [Mesorhizobium sp.]|uniref:hypothetical protein n=1 Tax=Mesorhizobium sp. TaxID=1871066 RepID=UPI00120E3ACE|nr:hypothetical protein [Mesorhizobium sp.]TIN40426.1 MAG: hypothetical protein E5Y13_11605 [Mesorhizobium sp.]TJU83812.1 MAG: hypothetical protein E5Y10_33550 [Mesorhizobium sp.]